MSLESDIERIALLRGKKPEEYTAKLNAPRQINAQLLANVFRGNGDIRSEMKVFDRLPVASREFIRSSPIWISACVWRALLDGAPSEASMIVTMRRVLAERVAQHDPKAHIAIR